MPTKREKDDITGVETTGHEWDGIKELNNPLPRWWLWIMFATIIFALIFWILHPSWPTLEGHSKGVLGFTRHGELAKETAAARAKQASYLDRIETATPGEILADASLREFAVSGGRSAYAMHCSQCHGSGAEGASGYPNLNDDEWIWGGSVEAIHTTILYGVRSGHDEGRESEMPAFVADEILNPDEVKTVAAFVASMSTGNSDMASSGGVLFAENCAVCHGDGGEGIAELGAPALNNQIWLYGGSEAELVETISNARHGVMPAWAGRLDEATLKQLAVYVHALGGGE